GREEARGKGEDRRAGSLGVGVGTADPAGGAVERADEAVAGGVALLAAEALELAPHQRVVALEELAPLAVAEPRGEGGRADDVGEEQGGEDAVRLRRGADTGQELLHLTKQGIRFTSPRQGGRARKLGQLPPRRGL